MIGALLGQAGGVDPWVAGALVTINIAAFTAVGAALWAVYQTVTSLDVALHGANGDQGFIEKTTESHAELAAEQRDMRGKLDVHGRLLNEVAYGARELAEVAEDELDGSVDTERLERAHERARRQRDSRWHGSGDGDGDADRGGERGE